MADLLIGNIEDGTTDDEISEFLSRYGFPPFDKIEHVPGAGPRPAVLLTFNDLDTEALRILQPRIQNVFWKDRTINAMIMREHGY
ncbi:hypothetical protein R69919_03064 [Paraburkholderia gardini]|uniref:RNA-binding protein n=2 Tax=Paraburkholderia gardini TaxID=2823469 RepID=A0ABM8U4Q1_9BURK|nr:RNA-binding protein [Paraburkholderia gardini]CAG4902331.1 hypothetical protein R54767_02842 [Paraburkholderia gardini]CAG4903487.1 hypothetical protein R69919_03064 [Paraburkholderia gardini]